MTNKSPIARINIGSLDATDADSSEAILDGGRELLVAKQSLPHGEFTGMVQNELPFGERTAQRYMAVARHPILSNPTRVSLLPASLRVLYELSRAEPDELGPELKRIANRCKSVDDWELEIPSLLVRLDCKRAMGRPSVTAQGVQSEVQRQVAVSVASDDSPPVLRVCAVRPGSVEFAAAARRLPDPGIAEAELSDPAVEEGRILWESCCEWAFDRLRLAWKAHCEAEFNKAAPEVRARFLAWLLPN